MRFEMRASRAESMPQPAACRAKLPCSFFSLSFDLDDRKVEERLLLSSTFPRYCLREISDTARAQRNRRDESVRSLASATIDMEIYLCASSETVNEIQSR